MNSRRAANRRRSMDRDNPLRYPKGEKHTEMRGRMPEGREPEHTEMNYNPTHEPHASHRSPASSGASMGPGPLPGAGELRSPGSGPGEASKRIRFDQDENSVRQTPSGDTPRGMKIYNQE